MGVSNRLALLVLGRLVSAASHQVEIRLGWWWVELGAILVAFAQGYLALVAPCHPVLGDPFHPALELPCFLALQYPVPVVRPCHPFLEVPFLQVP